jgi:hypothetical protein
MNITELLQSNAYIYTKSVVVPHEKAIKEIQEIEQFDSDYVLYMSDSTSYGISQCQSIEKTYKNLTKNL